MNIFILPQYDGETTPNLTSTQQVGYYFKIENDEKCFRKTILNENRFTKNTVIVLLLYYILHSLLEK